MSSHSAFEITFDPHVVVAIWSENQWEKTIPFHDIDDKETVSKINQGMCANAIDCVFGNREALKDLDIKKLGIIPSNDGLKLKYYWPFKIPSNALSNCWVALKGIASNEPPEELLKDENVTVYRIGDAISIINAYSDGLKRAIQINDDHIIYHNEFNEDAQVF